MDIRGLQTSPHGLWVFDNDGTLYRGTETLRKAVEEKMICFISQHFRISREEAVEKRECLLRQYQTKYTLIALKGEGIDPDLFIAETYLAVDPRACGIVRDRRLHEVLSDLVGEKVVLTNNPAPFARMIFKELGIEGLISHVYGMAELSYLSKPHPSTFRLVQRAQENDIPVVYVDDHLDNILAVHALGVSTVLVGGGDAMKAPGYHISSLNEAEVTYVGAQRAIV